MFRLRNKLKASSGTSQIFVNGDLTARRAALARDARVQGVLGTTQNTSIFNRRILLKDWQNKIFVVRRQFDIPSV